jgi:hypothetical protein
MSKNALVIGLALFAGAAASAGGQSPTSAMPKDPCALLTAAEIQEVAGTLVKDGTAGKIPALGAISCTYTWGPANYSATGQFQLNVLVTEAAKAFPGMSTALIKQAMAARVKSGGVAGEVPGIGDAATFESDQPIRVNAKTLAKGLFLSVELEGPNARLQKDQVIALLKTAAGRL